MAKLVTKVKYLHPNGKRSAGAYAMYIATREGVDKIDRSKKDYPATERQKILIPKLIHDFPDCESMPEYEDYLATPTISNASEFISRAIEDNDDAIKRSGYAEYIALRPRTERFGSHGLFTDEGVPVELSKVAKELDCFDGNVWTIILSLRREDAERLGYNRGERWRDLIRSETGEIAKAFRLPLTDMKWYAAFHNESHHPHVHILVYSEGRKPYLSKNAVLELRAAFARDIFAQDLLCVYEKQTEYRNDLRMRSREKVAQIVDAIKKEGSVDPSLAEKIYRLAMILSRTNGKKQYGYLKADVKALVCSIVDDLAADPHISELYDLWYSQREEVFRTYTDELPERIPLSENREFRPILNAVIAEAVELQNTLNEKEPLEVDSSKAASEETNEDIDEYKPANDTNHYRAENQEREARLVSESGSRLLIALCGLLSAQMYDQPWMTVPKVESKLRKKINEKKIAHGQKIERGFSGGEIHPVQ